MITYQSAIHEEIGNIIEGVQYIEWNLLGRLGLDTFEEMTLGQIVGLVQKHKFLHSSAIEELETVLKRRNDLVHIYFKRKDFERNANNLSFLETELRYLKNFSRQVDDFNSWLINL